MTVSDPTDRAQRATQHRPRDARAIQATIHKLHAQGLGDYAVTTAIGASVEFIRGVLDKPLGQEVV